MKKLFFWLGGFKSGLFVYSRTFFLVWQARPWLTLWSLLTSVFSALVFPAQIWITKLIIDRFALLISHPVRVQPANTISTLLPLLLPVGLYFGIWALGEFFKAGSRGAQNLLTEIAQCHAQYLLLEKAARLPVAFYESPAGYDQMELARSQVWRFANAFFYVIILVTQVISILSLILLLGRVSPLIPLVLVLTELPRLVTQAGFVNRMAQLVMRNVHNQRMMGYLSWLLTAREAVKEIRLFHLQDHFLKVYRSSNQSYLAGLTKVTIQKEGSNFALSLISLLGTGFSWGFTLVQSLLSRVTLGDIALVFQSTENCRSSLDELMIYIGYAIENSVFLKSYFDFLDFDPQTIEGTLSQPVPGTSGGKIGDSVTPGVIEFQHVSFKYPGSDRSVLRDVSFTLAPGSVMALVGENGAGKTTLIKLLTRLYDPTEGQILFNGQNLRDIGPETHYRQIGVIFQDFVHYNLTARENIAVGCGEAMDDQTRVVEAARMGGALPLIEGLPQGFETRLGKLFEGGVDLSGGEWQKIALARAFMRPASLLILDEPTAALDASAENEVYLRFAELTHGKTTVFVTHRLSSVKMAQTILVLKEGQLIEQGNHEDLLTKGGEYARLFTLQAERYQ